jgi:hypothetical protein
VFYIFSSRFLLLGESKAKYYSSFGADFSYAPAAAHCALLARLCGVVGTRQPSAGGRIGVTSDGNRSQMLSTAPV